MDDPEDEEARVLDIVRSLGLRKGSGSNGSNGSNWTVDQVYCQVWF